ncbi:hypothetical protein DYB32_006664 [Aphanomyces invadans]|uniref:very-long-chain (3R)-3-hydroxyacyl-CoA dehydratase n=1 Tax=Aphanomyces invadans TaxID=157072 RepID=A0A3R6Z1M9_9STRA|nr:hypothetical protein DYB32_006664 [Aphanomyces invadans]
MALIKTAYLVLFNLASSLGWAYVLGQTFQLVYADQDIALSSAKLWGVIDTPLKVVQTMAVFEALHAMLGLVRSPVPDWLFFLRYHLFMVLYPSGVTGEVTCMVKALPFLSTGAYSIQMPNTHNISVSLYVIVLLTLVVYAPGLPFMYTHMNVQRKKAYAKKNETKTLKKD